VLATQRPSVNVITGLIKANFPCRVAFRVSAKVDSRTILDQNGAETLLGNGDMLFLPPGKSEPQRVQGAFISTEETERLMDWYRAHAERAVTPTARASTRQVTALEAAEKAGDEGGGTGDEAPRRARHPVSPAAEVCIQNQLGSTSLLQRRMSIGTGAPPASSISSSSPASSAPPTGPSRGMCWWLDELDGISGP